MGGRMKGKLGQRRDARKEGKVEGNEGEKVD
jgi:hypothetical protein